ncbi:MAG: Grx4 family monothiol glutaredoxin [Pseudomonadota bacterium]
MSDSAVFEAIKKQLADHKIVLFMKGSKEQPQCGFSARVVQILDHLQADYQDINVLADDAIRQGIKDFSDWPTIPQLYVKGEFVGGCDIISEMFSEGELQDLIKQAV